MSRFGILFVFGGLTLLLATGIALVNSPRQEIAEVFNDPRFTVLGYDVTRDEATGQDVRMIYKIPAEECARQPVWDPAPQEPPMTLGKLKEIAYTHLFGANKEAWSIWKVTNLIFQRFGSDGEEQRKARENRWFCQLTITSQDPNRPASKMAYLLLDGTFVPSEPAPGS